MRVHLRVEPRRNIGSVAAHSEYEYKSCRVLIQRVLLFSFQEDEGLYTTPMDERWLQDRRVHSTRLSDNENSLGSDVLDLFRRFTRYYRPVKNADHVSISLEP